MLTRRNFMKMAVGGASMAAIGLPGVARAQPAAGVTRLVVGFTAGAGADAIARKLAEKLGGAYAETVIVENRPGAGGRIALDTVKQAAPDGRTLLFTPASPMILAPHIYANLSYDPVRDFAPITGISSLKLGLVVGAGTPAHDLSEYIAWCNSDPRRTSFGSPGAGTLPHFLGIGFSQAAALNLVHVPYKGAGPAFSDLLGGQIPAYVGILGADVIANQRAGKVRVLAVAGEQRSPALPDIPTFVELGYPNVRAQEWMAVFGPASMSAENVTQANAVLTQAMGDPDVLTMLERYSMEPTGWPTNALSQRLHADLQAWGPIIKASGFQPEA